jgi:hypothetical protein
MEISGLNNKNATRLGINNQIYYPFLSTSTDKVEISGQTKQSEDQPLEDVKNLIDPKKNYQRLSVKIAGTAGAGVLLAGLAFLTIFKGKSGFLNERLGNYIQRLRGQTFNLQHETSLKAKINYHLKTGLVKIIDNGLNSWVNFDQLKNVYIDQKIIQKSPLQRPFNWATGQFKHYAQKTNLRKYNQSVKEAKNLEKLLPDLKNAVKQANMDNFGDKIKLRQLVQDYPDLNINENSSRSEVIEAIIKEIARKTDNLANSENFIARQKAVEDNLSEKILHPYMDEFKMLSDKNVSISGIKETIHGAANDVKKLSQSREDIISRRNKEVRNITKDKVYIEKEKITRTIADNCQEASVFIKEAEDNIRAVAKNDPNLFNLYTSQYENNLRNIEETMKFYKNAKTSSGKITREYNKQAFIKNIENLKAELTQYNNNQLEDTIKLLDNAKDRIVESDKKGLLEELREVMKCSDNGTCNSLKINHSSLYNSFKRTTAALSNKLNKAANFETDNLFFRQMDLTLGGGNFEIFGLSAPIAFGVHSVLKTDDSDERVSKGIRTGSVIGGGLAGWFTSGVILCLSAGNSMMFSLGSGLIADKIGKFIDNKFWSKGKDWDEINKQKKIEAKALKNNQ